MDKSSGQNYSCAKLLDNGEGELVDASEWKLGQEHGSKDTNGTGHKNDKDCSDP